MSSTHFSDLVRARICDGRPTTPEELDSAIREVAEVEQWARQKGLDRVQAVSRGLLTALTQRVVVCEPPY